MPDNPDEIAKRARIVREVAIRARAEGRLAPTLAELNEALGDNDGLDYERRKRAGKTPKRYGIQSQIDRSPAGGRARHHGPRSTHHGPREE